MAFLVKPIGWQEGKKYPLVLSVHGGPAGQYGVDWYHEFQVYAAKGYAVLFTNPRGSTGYGQKFERGIVNEWGGKDYLDVMNGLDAALEEISLDRSESSGRDRRKLWRLHDQLDCRSYRSFQSGGDAAQRLELYFR